MSMPMRLSIGASSRLNASRLSSLAGPSRITQCRAPRRLSATSRPQSTWSAVIDSAKHLVGSDDPIPPSKMESDASLPLPPFGSPKASTPPPIIRDPLELVGKEMSSLRSNVSTLLGSGHPSLDSIAKYYFQAEGKHIRPLIVLLMARATNGISPLWPELQARAKTEARRRDDQTVEIEHEMGINEPLSPREVLNDFNPHMESIEGQQSMTGSPTSSANIDLHILTKNNTKEVKILPTQRRLAEITEMIHVASLLHDDVIDASSLRRGQPSAPAAFGNKLSILGGDFLLGRASVALARLRNNEVVELLATVIANLVEGEVMQLRSQNASNGTAISSQKSAFSSFWTAEDLPSAEQNAMSSEGPSSDVFEHYLQKTYLKTAALIGKSARAATILGGFGSNDIADGKFGSEIEASSQIIRDAAYSYGRNLGIAFQLVDDLLDFQSTSAAFGKPSGGADLRLGLATAPILYAWQEFPSEGLGEMVKRKFEGEGDVEKALGIVRRSNGLEKTRVLARHHAQLAHDALSKLPPSEARDALSNLNQQVITRVK
ncbi:hypothetical protein CBS101457_001882 [Exobasidium rhododendri]|nr:hypothetical protein CBS101457_001882 [Exobasidium rhododendri]